MGFCLVLFSDACPGPGYEGNSLNREIQTLLSPPISSTAPGDTKTCPRSALGSPPRWACLIHLPREMSRRCPDQMPEPPQLAPLNAEENQLYSEPLPDV